MKAQSEFDRNEPSEEGKRNDPNIRDESAIQPGVHTVSRSKTDAANQDVTLSGMENQAAAPQDDQADPAFDEGRDKV